MKRIFMPLMLLAVTALIVAGCGGGGGGSSSGGGGGISVAINPATKQLAPGGSCTFTATVSGATDPSVTWTASGGNISYGNYVAPSNSGTYKVYAYSNEDQSKSATANVTVSSGVVDPGDDPNKPPDPPVIP